MSGLDPLTAALSGIGSIFGFVGKKKQAKEQLNSARTNATNVADYTNTSNANAITDKRAAADYDQGNLNARRAMGQGLFATLDPNVTGIDSAHMNSILAGSRSAPTKAAAITNAAMVKPEMIADPTVGSTWNMLGDLAGGVAGGMAERSAAKKATAAGAAAQADIFKKLQELLRGSSPASPSNYTKSIPT